MGRKEEEEEKEKRRVEQCIESKGVSKWDVRGWSLIDPKCFRSIFRDRCYTFSTSINFIISISLVNFFLTRTGNIDLIIIGVCTK